MEKKKWETVLISRRANKAVKIIKDVKVTCAAKIALALLFIIIALCQPDRFSPFDKAFGQGVEENAKTVASFLELKSALEDSTTTTVYLDADMVIPLGGITINPAKKNLLIDGKSPLSGVMHTITDYNSLAASDTISLESNGSLKTITLQNITIYGKNYYGTVCIYDVVSNVNVAYHNIKYYGPQLTYNTNGTAYYQDCYIEIGKFGAVSPAQELAEAYQVTFAGDVSVIQVDSQAYEIIYATKAGKIEIAKNADVFIKTYSDSGFFFGLASADFTVLENARFRYEGPRRFWEGVAFKNVTIQHRGSIYIDINNLNLNALLQVSGSLQVNTEAEMILINRGNASYAVLNMNGGEAHFKNPKRVVLYNAGYRPVYYTIAGAFFIDAQQIRYWDAATVPFDSAGGFEDVPLYHWVTSDGNNVEVSGTATTGASGNFSALNTNYQQTEGSETPLTKDTFQLSKARVMAFGRLHLAGEYVGMNEESSKIIGFSEPGANIIVTYVDGIPEKADMAAVADEDGGYQVFPEGKISEGAIITVKSNKLFLFSEITFPASNQTFKFSIESENIQFETAYLYHETQIIKRVNPDWEIVVTDSRGAGSRWELAAMLTAPLSYTDDDDVVYTLEDALIFIDENGQTYLLETDAEVLIISHTTANNVDITAIKWEEDKGILARIKPKTAQLDIPYQGKILWLLKSVP